MPVPTGPVNEVDGGNEVDDDDDGCCDGCVTRADWPARIGLLEAVPYEFRLVSANRNAAV